MKQNNHRQTNEAYTIHFPKEVALGRVWVIPRGDDPVQQHLWEQELPARGPVIIPASHLAVLFFSGSSLAALQTLPSDAIDKLRLTRFGQNNRNTGYKRTLHSDEISYLENLSGLRALDLIRIDIDKDAQRKLETYTHITDMTLVGGEYDDDIFSMLESMHALESLAIDDTTITNSAVARLQHLPNLHTLSGFQPDDALMPIIAQFAALRNLDLGEGAVTDDGLAYCTDMPHLEALSLEMSERVGNKGLRHLSSASNLRILNLRDMPRVTNAGLAALQALPNLQQIYLFGTRISDRGMIHLKEMSALEVLDIPPTITDKGLRVLPSIPKLRVLDLQGNTEVTDAGLNAIATCPALQVIDLSATAISDAGLALLKDMSHLRVLKLWDVQVSDKGLAHLYEHTKLEHIMVPNIQVTERGIAALQEALPQCTLTVQL